MSNPSRPTNAFRLDVERRGNATIVKFAGSANMEVSSDLREQLIELVDDQFVQLVLDMSELEFICSVGLGAIIAAHLRCRHCNGVVKLVDPKPAIRELLEVTRLTKLFDLYDSVDSALAAG